MVARIPDSDFRFHTSIPAFGWRVQDSRVPQQLVRESQAVLPVWRLWDSYSAIKYLKHVLRSASTKYLNMSQEVQPLFPILSELSAKDTITAQLLGNFSAADWDIWSIYLFAYLPACVYTETPSSPARLRLAPVACRQRL